ncbi:BtpA/SgcQ family protein [bacterium]|nr:BtpA/SgcQ family protein [bacterium]
MPNLSPQLIGVIHLPALAGAPGAYGEHPSVSLQKAGARAVQEALTLTKAGFHSLILENFGDVPFHKGRVSAETLASLAVIAAAVREAVRVPVGINILRNDALSALAVASVTGCDFIRVNVLSGVAATDQGIVEGDAATLLRERDRLGSDIEIFADALVKHARSLSGDDLRYAVEDLVLRAKADAVLVTGPTTGRSVEDQKLEEASQICRELSAPLYVASGVSAKSVENVLRYGVAGVIVGSDLRSGGRAGAALDSKRIKNFVKAFKDANPKRGKKKK